jgi:hypothetical protein
LATKLKEHHDDVDLMNKSFSHTADFGGLKPRIKFPIEESAKIATKG